MVVAIVAGGILFILSVILLCCCIYQRRHLDDRHLVLPTKEVKEQAVLHQNYLGSPPPPPPPRKGKGNERGVVHEGYVETENGAGKFEKCALVLTKSGALMCYTNMMKSNEGHSTYVGEKWSLAAESIQQKTDGPGKTFSIKAVWGDVHNFRAPSSKEKNVWLGFLNSTRTIKKQSSSRFKGKKVGSGSDWLQLS